MFFRLLPILLLSLTLIAQETKDAGPIPEPKEFKTQGKLKTENATIAYTAIAGETYLKNAKEEPTASIYSIAYLQDDVADKAMRPVTFVFNGGPGSSAVWLHLGLLGPHRVVVPSDGSDVGAPPYRWEPNSLSLLEVSDLVFIDPVGTGYSRPLGKSEGKDFWGLDEDAVSVAEFIRSFITKHERWNSPKYIAGESYGTIRAAMLVGELQRTFTGIALNGIMLIAPAIDMQTLMFSDGPDLPYALYLPTFAATAWYHDRLPQKPADMISFLDEVARFAAGDYTVALFKGDSLEPAEKERIVARLHQYTGLSETYWRRANLRVNSTRFMKEVLRDKGLTVGRLDSRYLEDDPDDVGEYPSNDPASTGVSSAFVSILHDYQARILKVDIQREYEVLNLNANGAWKRPPSHQSLFSGYINTMPLLTRGAAENKDLRFFVASGYFDLTTTYFSTEYMFNHSNIDKNRITMKHYPSGHMMYLHVPSFRQLAGDLKEFVRQGGIANEKNQTASVGSGTPSKQPK